MSVFFSIMALPRYAAEVAGIYRCDSYVADNTKLSLVGVGMPRSWEFKDYTGAFYLKKGTSIKDIFSDRAKRIELEYFR
jgi:hypothetical protein